MNKEFKPDWVSPPSHTIIDSLTERGWGCSDLSEKSGLLIATCYDLIRGHIPINPTTARGLAQAFGTSEEFWLNRQRDYEKGPSWATEPMNSSLCPILQEKL